MSINAKNEGGGNSTPVAAGTYAARCYSMIELGTIKGTYMGEDIESHKVQITWELPTEKKVFKEDKGEQPFSISKEFTLSMHEKANLRKMLEGWRGKGFTDEEAKCFDITKLLGKPCMLSIIHKTSAQGKQYAVISSIATVPKGMTVPEQINKTFELSFLDFNKDNFESLPDWLKDKIKGSKEYRRTFNPEHHEVNQEQPQSNDEPMDEMPF